MSKSIMIPEGGIARGFTAERLKVPLEAGGYELLVPESAVGLGELRATVNRRYRASEDGLFAYSVVKTDVPEGKSVTGKGPDGKKYKVTVDDGGNIVETPEGTGDAVRIAVTTPPTITTYGNRAYIGFDGIVVTAYDEAGNSLGAVPYNELIFPITIAELDGTEEYEEAGCDAVYSGSVAGFPYPQIRTIRAYRGYEAIYNAHITITTESNNVWHVPVLVDENHSYVFVYHLSQDEHASFTNIQYQDGIETSRRTYDNLSPDTTFNNNSYFRVGTASNYTNYQELSIQPNPMVAWGSDDVARQAATILFDGIMTEHEAGYQKAIPVQWRRTGDGTLLETSFQITIVDLGGGGSGEDDNPIVNP